MPNDLTPVLAAIAGGSIAFLGIAVQQYLARSGDRRKLLREKVEEIYGLSNQLDEWGINLMHEMVQFLLGKEDADGKDNKQEGPANPMPRLLMLTKIYAPQLGPAAADLKEKADACQSAAREYYMRLAELAQTKTAPTDDEIATGLSPMDALQKSTADFRTLLERHVQQYI
jgi:hypothetical protein